METHGATEQDCLGLIFQELGVPYVSRLVTHWDREYYAMPDSVPAVNQLALADERLVFFYDAAGRYVGLGHEDPPTFVARQTAP